MKRRDAARVLDLAEDRLHGLRAHAVERVAARGEELSLHPLARGRGLRDAPAGRAPLLLSDALRVGVRGGDEKLRACGVGLGEVAVAHVAGVGHDGPIGADTPAS